MDSFDLYSAISLPGEHVVNMTTHTHTPRVPSQADFEVSCMILGSMVVGMIFFAMLNHRDHEVKLCSWHIVSTSTIIFLAVLISQSWQDILMLVILPRKSQNQKYPIKVTVVEAVSMTGWYIVLQITLAYVSGVIGPKPESLESALVMLKCWAVLLGLICAITNTQLWGFIMDYALAQVHHSLLAVFAVVTLAALTLFVMYSFTSKARRLAALRMNLEHNSYVRLWTKFTEEQEDIAICLTVAKLGVQGLQMWYSGFLQLALQEEGATERFTRAKTPVLAGLGLLLTSAIFMAAMWMTDLFLPETFGRQKEWAVKTFAMGVAYAFLHGIQALLKCWTGTSPFGAMLCALFVTMCTFLFTFVMAACAQKQSDQAAKERIKSWVQPMSLLVGFSWGGAFGSSLRTINATVHMASAQVQTPICAIVFSLIVIPAWKQHILPMTMDDSLCRKLIILATSKTCSFMHLSNEANEPLLQTASQNAFVEDKEDAGAEAERSK